jgi:hypothetical protein
MFTHLPLSGHRSMAVSDRSLSEKRRSRDEKDAMPEGFLSSPASRRAKESNPMGLALTSPYLTVVLGTAVLLLLLGNGPRTR